MTGALPPSSRCVRLVPFTAAAEHLLAARDRTRERDHRHLGLRDQRRADGVAATADDVDDARRKQLRADGGELERRERRLLGRLEHHGVARGERRRHLPGRHHQWIVPGRDRRDHADGIAADHAGEARQIFARDRAMHRARSAREEAEHIGDRGDLVVQRRVQRLAAVLRFEARELHGLGFDAIGELQQQRAAILRHGRGPARKSFRGRFHSRGDLLLRGLGHLRDDLAGGGIEHAELVALAFDQLAVNEQFRVHRRAS